MALPSSLKVVAIALGATGATGGIVYTTLKQTGVLNTTSLKSPFIKEGSCTFMEHSTLSGNLQFDELRGGDYTTISCQDINSKSTPRGIASEWAGWFTKDVLAVNVEENFEKNFKLTLEIDTKEIKDNSANKYKTTFSLRSDKFSSTPVIGVLESSSKEIPNQSLITVKMTSEKGESSKNFHLLFIGHNRRG